MPPQGVREAHHQPQLVLQDRCRKDCYEDWKSVKQNVWMPKTEGVVKWRGSPVAQGYHLAQQQREGHHLAQHHREGHHLAQQQQRSDSREILQRRQM